jgi:hypothetical protein
MRIANTTDVAITSLTIQVAGLPVEFSWDSTSHLLPRNAVSRAAAALPLGLPFAVGNVYPVTTTARLPDATTETQRTSAIYTLGAALGL